MIENPLETATYAATAHIPGAIPGKTCGQCAHFIKCKSEIRGRCHLHFRFRGLDYLFKKEDVDWWRGLDSISATTPACKYFWERAT